jgi:hypothetical protein
MRPSRVKAITQNQGDMGPSGSDFSWRNDDLAMFNLAIDSKLRACDVTALKVDDVAMSGHVNSRAMVIQRKLGSRSIPKSPSRRGIRLLAGSIRPDIVTTASSVPAAFVWDVRYVLASMPHWSHARSHRLASTLRGTARIRCGARSRH